MALSEVEFNELVEKVKQALAIGSQGVNDVPEAENIDGISSLPGYEYPSGAQFPKVVKVPLTVLAAPALQAAKEALAAAKKAEDAAATIGTTMKEYIDALVAGAPEAFDTLKELADALGNDPNFATTVATELGKKIDKTSIVDNLVSDVAEKVLSAKQGKVLSEKVENAQNILNGITKYSNGIAVERLSTGGTAPVISVDISGGGNGLNKIANGVEVWAGGRKLGYWTAGGLRLTVPIHCSAGFFQDYS